MNKNILIKECQNFSARDKKKETVYIVMFTVESFRRLSEIPPSRALEGSKAHTYYSNSTLSYGTLLKCDQF